MGPRCLSTTPSPFFFHPPLTSPAAEEVKTGLIVYIDPLPSTSLVPSPPLLTPVVLGSSHRLWGLCANLARSLLCSQHLSLGE